MLPRRIQIVFNNIGFKWLASVNRSFYDSRTKDDTIFSPITTLNSSSGSPLGVIRVSGRKTRNTIEQIVYTSLKEKEHNLNSTTSRCSALKIKPRYATLASFHDPQSRDLIDKGLLLWFPGPNSYTGEDSCEFHLHGSQAIMTAMLMALGRMHGLRPSEPGEFTKRAVLNGKMSLIQAESLPDLIASKTDLQRRMALSGLEGSVKNRYNSWINKLVKILAHIEASIDFGEDQLLGEHQVVLECAEGLQALSDEVKLFIRQSSSCRNFVKSGARIVILGKPNSGKSTLMNLLCRQDKSIVSDLSGTTRDIVEHSFQLKGHAVSLFDTAGIRKIQSNVGSSTDSSLIDKHSRVEEEGIRRAYEVASKADVVIYLIDGSNLCGKLEIQRVIDDLTDTLAMEHLNLRADNLRLVVNKIDLNADNENDLIKTSLTNALKSTFSELPDPIFISCLAHVNLDELVGGLSDDLNRLASIETQFRQGNSYLELNYVNERHLSLLQSVSRHLVLASQMRLRSIDEMAQHVRESVDYLSRIVGTVTNEEVIDVIFKDFCIGK